MNGYYVEHENEISREVGVEFFPLRRESTGNTTFAHLHPAPELLYLTEGTFEITCNGSTVTARAGDLALFRANTVHAVRLICAPGGYLVLKVSPTMLFRIFSGPAQLACSMPFLRYTAAAPFVYPSSALAPEVPALFREMENELSVGDHTVYIAERILASRLLLTLLRTLPGFSEKEQEGGGISRRSLLMIFDILTYLNENCASELTVGGCAERLHISYSYFARLFRLVTGKTFQEYLISIRLARAEELLGTTDLPITEIASASGYNSVAYFISEYRRAFGITPGRSRRG